MTDGRFLRCFKAVIRACRTVDIRVTRAIAAARGEPVFRLGGRCLRCGACCKTPMIKVSPLFFRSRILRRALLHWFRAVNGMNYLEEDPENVTFTFECTHWDRESRRCDSYSSRPAMCRDYPRVLLYSSDPDFLEPCGYFPVIKNADEMREALKQAGLSPEEIRNLETKLHLGEAEGGED